MSDRQIVPLHPEREPAEAAKRLEVGVVKNPAGSGKTRGMAEWFGNIYSSGGTLHEIVASPTTALIKQTAKTLVEFGIPEGCIKQIHTKTGAKKTIRVQMTEYFRKMPADEHSIVLVAHAGMQLERPPLTEMVPDKRELEAARREGREPDPAKRVEMDIWNPAEWSLWWDEAPEILQFDTMYAPRQHRMWTRLMHAEHHSDGLFELTPQADWDDADASDQYLDLLEGRRERGWYPLDALKAISRNKPYDQHEEPVAKLCGDVANSNKLVLVMKEQWTQLLNPRAYRDRKTYMHGVLDVMCIHHPNAYGDYKSVTIMGARLDNTMALTLWDKIWGIKIFEHPLAEKLERVHSTKRLRVHYVYENRASRAFLSNRSKASDGHRTMFQETAIAIAKYLDPKKGQLPIWNAPQTGGDKEHGVKADFFTTTARAERMNKNWFSPDKRLPGKTHGLNRFLPEHAVVLLSVLRFTPSQNILLQRIGLTEEQVDRAFQYNENYQSVMRTNARVKDGREITFIDEATGKKIHTKGEGIVDVHVMDRPSADDLMSSFPNVTVEAKQLPAHLVPEEQPTQQSEPRPDGYDGWDEEKKSAWRSQQYRKRQRAANAQKAASRERMDSRVAEGG